MAENKMEPLYFWIRYFKEHINKIGCVELDGLDCREVLALLQELADKKVDKPIKNGAGSCMNNFDKLLGRNGELVEERKKQVLAGALEIVQRHYKETPNKMEVIAALFGKKLGERFTVERDHDRFDCEFSTCGCLEHGAYENPYMDFDCFILEDLLTGKAVIVNE